MALFSFPNRLSGCFRDMYSATCWNLFYTAVCNKYSPVRAAATGTDCDSSFLVAMQLSRPSSLAEESLHGREVAERRCAAPRASGHCYCLAQGHGAAF